MRSLYSTLFTLIRRRCCHTLCTVFKAYGFVLVGEKNNYIEEKERKGKEVDLCSAYRQYNSTIKRSDVDHTETCANTPHLPLLRISIH